jgi:hypothetical protein
MDFGLAIDALISRSRLGGTWPSQRKKRFRGIASVSQVSFSAAKRRPAATT